MLVVAHEMKGKCPQFFVDSSLPGISVAPPFETVEFRIATRNFNTSIITEFELDLVGREEN